MSLNEERTVAASAGMSVEGLPGDYRRLVQQRLRGGATSNPDPHGYKSIPVATDRAHTSPAQQRVWLMQHLAADPAAPNVSTLRRVSGGPLNVPMLARALADLGHRHEVLRTRYQETGGELRACAWHDDLLLAGYVDLADVTADVALDTALRLAERDALRPFDLARDTPVRLTVYRLGPADHVLHACLHHIAVDGASMELFWRDLAATYDALLHGRPAPAGPPIQYADFASWQNAWLRGPEAAEQLAFWRELLDGAPSHADVTPDHERPKVLRSDAGMVETVVSPHNSHRLRGLARAEGATAFMTLLAAFYVLLSGSTGRTDMIVGSPIAGRSRPELDNVIGVFANTIALRMQWTGDPTFRRLLGMTRSMALSAYQHQDIPFQRVVQVLRPRRERNRTPFFNVWFDLAHQQQPPGFARLQVSELPVRYSGTSVDLALRVIDAPAGFSCCLLYRADLYEATTVQRLASRFVRLLEAVAERPDGTISSIWQEIWQGESNVPG
ncbi:condensation domain-containing protein [Micromonospora marina]|uniref:condensation domain-containing protein n=1 Tax=Micromonospora marina TaxID=307120 RepID=UPI003D71F8BB